MILIWPEPFSLLADIQGLSQAELKEVNIELKKTMAAKKERKRNGDWY